MVVTDENKNVIKAVTRDYRMGQRKSVPQPPPPPPGQSVCDKLVNYIITNTATSDYRNFYVLKIRCSSGEIEIA